VSTPIVGCILTLDEERTIARAVSSLARVADRIVVVDSGSTDGTTRLARELGAIVLEHPFTTYAEQRNWALEQIVERFGQVYVFTLDADEWLSDGLVAELDALRDRIDAHDLYLIPLRRRFDGRILRFGGFGRTWLVRLHRAGTARFEGREVNEHLAVPAGTSTGRLTGWLEHDDVASWEDYIDKHNRYSTLEARARVEQRRRGEPAITVRTVLRDPTMRRRFLRQRIWDRLPARPALRFVQVYVAFGGFLDGRPGFRRALFEAWQEMCIDLKAERLERGALP